MIRRSLAVVALLAAATAAYAQGPRGMGAARIEMDELRVIGMIASVDAEAGEFSVSGLPVRITEDTVLRSAGEEITLAELEAEVVVGVVGKMADGVLVAQRVGVKKPGEGFRKGQGRGFRQGGGKGMRGRHGGHGRGMKGALGKAAREWRQCDLHVRGEITALDTQAQTITVNDTVLTIGESTKVHIGRQAGSFADLAIGQQVRAGANSEDGTMVAVRIGVRPETPEAD